MSVGSKWGKPEKATKREPLRRQWTYEEKVEAVKEVLNKVPNATRSKITQWTGFKSTILDEMEANGDIKLPPKKRTTSRTTPWMKTIGNLSGR